MATIIQFFSIAIFFLITACVASIENKFSMGVKKLLIFILIFIISMIASVRTIGTDTQNYINIISAVPQISYLNLSNIFEFTQEPGFILFTSILKTLGANINVILFFFSFIPLSLISSIIIKNDSKNALFSFLIFSLIYIFRGPLDIIRQFFAMAFLLVAMYHLSQEKHVKYYLNVFLSLILHYASITTLFTRKIFQSMQISIEKYLSIGCVSFIAGFLSKQVLTAFFTNRYFTISIFNKVGDYLLSDYDYFNFAHFLSRTMMEYSLPILNILMIVYLFKHQEYIKLNSFNGIIFNAMVIGSFIFLFLLGLGEGTMAIRMNYLFQIGNFIILKDILTIKPTKGKYLVCILVLFTYNILIGNYYSNAFKLTY